MKPGFELKRHFKIERHDIVNAKKDSEPAQNIDIKLILQKLAVEKSIIEKRLGELKKIIN